MRTIFAFDTATTVSTCAVLHDGTVLGARRAEARSVLAGADELMRAAGVAPRELDAIVVGTGPGSFTSIRMGLATARGLALALDIPAAGVSTLHAFSGGQPVIDARRGEVFTDGPRVSRPEELDVDGVRLIGDGAIRYRGLFEAAGAVIPADDELVHLPAAERLVAYVTSFGAAEAIEPLYLRPPDARPAP